VLNNAWEGDVMNKTENKQSRKLNLSRETLRILSHQELGEAMRRGGTTPICTEGGPRCEHGVQA
jgi:hypothetical protein